MTDVLAKIGERQESDGLCQCGCGQETKLATYTHASRGMVRGQPLRYIHGHNGLKQVHYIAEDRGYETPCWVWQLTVSLDGHGRFDVGGRLHMAHRVYFERCFGLLPEGIHLHHKCETPACVNPAHLEPLTPAQHKQTHSRLTWDDVHAIRAARADGVTLRVLSERYGLSIGHLSEIANGKVWKEAA